MGSFKQPESRLSSVVFYQPLTMSPGVARLHQKPRKKAVFTALLAMRPHEKRRSKPQPVPI
jgi:hypothetical protein